MTSSSQTKELLNNNSILPKKDPPEGKTTAIIAVMRGKPKDGHHFHRSNKHYKQKLVQVLLDLGSDGNLVFVIKDKPMLVPSLKRLVPPSWNTWVEYNKNYKPQYDLMIGVKTMKEFGIMLDFKDEMINIDEVKLPMQNINYLQGSSTLHALKLNHSLAMNRIAHRTPPNMSRRS